MRTRSHLPPQFCYFSRDPGHPHLILTLTSQPDQKPAAAEDDGSGFREENDFHQQHPKDWISHPPHRSYSPASPSGKSISWASEEGPDLSQLMVGRCHQQSPLPTWGHMLSSGLGPVLSQVCPVVTQECPVPLGRETLGPQTQGSVLRKVLGISRAGRPSPSENPTTSLPGKRVSGCEAS